MRAPHLLLEVLLLGAQGGQQALLLCQEVCPGLLHLQAAKVDLCEQAPISSHTKLCRHSACPATPASQCRMPADKVMQRVSRTIARCHVMPHKPPGQEATEDSMSLLQCLCVSAVHLAVQAGLLVLQGLLPLLCSFLCLLNCCLPLLQTQAHHGGSLEINCAARLCQASHPTDTPDRKAAQQPLIAQNAD